MFEPPPATLSLNPMRLLHAAPPLSAAGRLAALALLLPAAAGSLALAGCDAAGPDPATAGPATADARAVGGFTTVRMSGDGPVVTGRPAKVAVCHYDDDAGAFRLIEVGAPALPAHVRHGDGVPGGAVPGQEGSTFDAACAPVAVDPPFTCLAGVRGTVGGPTILSVFVIPDPGAPLLRFFGADLSNATVRGVTGAADGSFTVEIVQTVPALVSSATLQIVTNEGVAVGSCGPYLFGAPVPA